MQYAPPASLVPALKSDIVVIHVIVIFTAVAAFVVAGGAALIYLIEDRQLKRRRIGRVLGRLPALRTLDQLVNHAVMFGLPFLSMGIVAGIIRAETFGVRRLVGRRRRAAGDGHLVRLRRLGLPARGLGLARPAHRLAGLAGLVCLLAIRFVAVPYLSGFHNWGR